MAKTKSYIKTESADILINRRCLFIKRVRSAGWTNKYKIPGNDTVVENVTAVPAVPETAKVLQTHHSASIRPGIVKPVFLTLVIILLTGFIHMDRVGETIVFPHGQPAAQQEAGLKLAEDPKQTNRGAERKEIVRSLHSILISFNSLANHYDSAKVPGNPDKTAENFRRLQYKADVLIKELANIHIPDKDLGQIASLQQEMLSNFSNSCRYYAEYLEGKRKITEDTDWVNEANRLRWRSLAIRTQFEEKLQNIQI